MELKFNEKEVKEILIAQAKLFGIEANTVLFEGSYGLRSATVFFDPEKKEPKVEMDELTRLQISPL